MEKGDIRKNLHFMLFIKKMLGLNYEDEMERMHFYSVGAALFDLKNPEKLISKSKSPIILPAESDKNEETWSKRVIFPTGVVMDMDNEDLLIYSGESDIVTTVKKIGLNDILKIL